MVGINLSALKGTRPRAYLVRFLFGGGATVLAGVMAQHYGPAIGGLFLAFPAIFPAGATLIEEHEKKRKQKIGRDGACRGRMAVSIDAQGAALGAIGLIAFAAVLRRLLPGHTGWLIIPAATVAWVLTAMLFWQIRKRVRALERRARRSAKA